MLAIFHAEPVNKENIKIKTEFIIVLIPVTVLTGTTKIPS